MKSTIAKSIIKRVVGKQIDNSVLPISNTVADAVADQAAEAVAPLLVNATNNEPWYQSRVTLGSGFAVLASIGVIGGMLTGVMDFDIQVLAANLATLLGAAFALYGRYAAKKPLGE